MPQVKGGNKRQGGKSSRSGSSRSAKAPTPARDAVVKRSSDLGSIFMGIFFLVAILIAAAAWMGGSISIVETKANQLADGVAKTLGFSVQTIHVVEHLSPEQETRLRNALGVVEGDSMFRANPHELRDRLETVPGFGGIEVHRFWPDQIAIVATPLETSVLLRNDQTGEIVPMNMTGERAADDEPQGEFHLIQGVGALAAYPELHDELQNFPAIETRLRYAERQGERRWDLIMTSGVRVKLPEGMDRYPALASLAALQREAGVLDRQVQTIDMRDPARVYVRRRQLEAGLGDVERAG